MRRYVFLVRFALGVLFSVIAAVNVVPLPERWLPLAVALVMLVLLVWSEVEHWAQRSLPPEHVEQLRKLAGEFNQEVMQRDRVGPADSGDHFQIVLWNSFERHFKTTAKGIRRWNELIADLMASRQAISSRAATVAAQAEREHGLYALPITGALTRYGQLKASNPQLQLAAEENWSVMPWPNGRSVLFWGGRSVADLPGDATEADVERLKDAIRLLVQSVEGWDELAVLRSAEAKVASYQPAIRRELMQICHAHNYAGRCDLCR